MTQPAAPLTVQLFGAPSIAAGGEPLDLRNQKARALIFYLAATGRPHTRPHLASLLWSEAPTDNARRSLRATLFQIRQALAAAGLRSALRDADDPLRVQLADVACDVTAFRRQIADGGEAALAQAAGLARGPLLEGFSLPDTPLFDEWLELEGERIRQALLAALRQLVDAACARREWARAATLIKRQIDADPLAEDAHRRLIEIHLQSGAVGQALRQYRQLEAELHTALGITPAPETRALFQEALRLQQSGHAGGAAQPASIRAQPALPLVGRSGPLSQLAAIAEAARAGQGSTALIQGDVGIGKTRLLAELLAQLGAESPPWLILRGACSPFDDLISYGPFIEAFQGGALGELSDSLLAPIADAPAARDQFAYRILQTLRRLSQSAPIVLAIDDLQWASSSTLNLFGLLATRLRGLPLLLVGTVQRPEAIPALQRLITLERRRGMLQVIALPPLAQSTVTELLQRLAISPASIPALARWLHERSDGNPFILAEIIAQLRADAILTPAGGQWQLDSGHWLRWRAAYTLPETTHDLVAWRLRNLSAQALAAVEVLAVAGQPLPFELLSEVLALPHAALLPIADDLSNRRLVVEVGREQFALAHHLLREAVLHQISQVRRRLIHRQLAQTLARCPATQGEGALWELARHAVAGEDTELARRFGLQVLAHLPHDYAGAVTVDFLQHLHDLLAHSASPDELLRLTWVIGEVQQSLGHLPQAIHWRQQHLALAQRIGDVAAQATAQLELGELALVSNDYEAATAAASAGLAALAGLVEVSPLTASLRGRGHRLVGHALAMEGIELAVAERHLQDAAQAHRQSDDPRDLCASLFELGNVAAQRGDLLRALELYEEAARVAKAGQVHYFHALAANNLAYHRLLLGWPKAAQRALDQGQQLAEKHELLGALLHLTSTQGEIHLYAAEWDSAHQAFQWGLALAEELGNIERQAGYRAGLALVARGQRDLPSAIGALEEALLLIHGRGFWHLRTRIQLWLAESYLQTHQIAQARQQTTALLESTQLHGRTLLSLHGLRLQASVLAASGRWDHAEACFSNAVAQATQLDLPLEIARSQAAWGRALAHNPSDAPRGVSLVREAEQIFTAHQAIAELQGLQAAQ